MHNTNSKDGNSKLWQRTIHRGKLKCFI